MSHHIKPGLFGLDRSNRDFTKKDSWGKNQFNSSFPAALLCYMESQGKGAIYLNLQNGDILKSEEKIQNIIGVHLNLPNNYFIFESIYSHYQIYIEGNLPRTDLVIQNYETSYHYIGLEVKLTAIPDQTTFKLDSYRYGSELVVRPDTIVYLACSLARNLGPQLKTIFGDWNLNRIKDWEDAKNVIPHLEEIILILKEISQLSEPNQTPFLLQPIWKTEGKSSLLADDCLDSFIWSDAAFLHFIINIFGNTKENLLERQKRTAIWLFLMMLSIAEKGKFDAKYIIDTYTYNTKNDKAFAASGIITNRFMACERLRHPTVRKVEIQNIILGGGERLLSPERRFDAAIVNDSTLFRGEFLGVNEDTK